MIYTHDGFDEAQVAPSSIFSTPSEFVLRKPRRGVSQVAAHANRERWLRSMRKHFGGVRAARRQPYMPAIPCALCGIPATHYYFRRQLGRCRAHRHIAPPGLQERADRWFGRLLSTFEDTRLSSFGYTREDTPQL